MFYFNKTVEYFAPVIKEKYRYSQALSKIIFEAMADASFSGFKRWNWGGTWLSQEGVHRFKKRWGTEECLYSYLIKINKDLLINCDQNYITKNYPYIYVLPYNKLIKNHKIYS